MKTQRLTTVRDICKAIDRGHSTASRSVCILIDKNTISITGLNASIMARCSPLPGGAMNDVVDMGYCEKKVHIFNCAEFNYQLDDFMDFIKDSSMIMSGHMDIEYQILSFCDQANFPFISGDGSNAHTRKVELKLVFSQDKRCSFEIEALGELALENPEGKDE